MEHYITDILFASIVKNKSAELEDDEKQIYTKLSTILPLEEYLRIEENLNRHYNNLGKETFYRGFMEGIHFLLKCL